MGSVELRAPILVEKAIDMEIVGGMVYVTGTAGYRWAVPIPIAETVLRNAQRLIDEWRERQHSCVVKLGKKRKRKH